MDVKTLLMYFLFMEYEGYVKNQLNTEDIFLLDGNCQFKLEKPPEVSYDTLRKHLASYPEGSAISFEI